MRVGFVGELGYEIHVPAGYGEALWDALLEAGKPEGIRPFGVEAQRVLRLEKGHIIVSQDTDGLTNVWEADMPWALAKTKPFFVGGRSTEIMAKMPAAPEAGRLHPERMPAMPCPEECHLVLKGEEIVGRVTSAVKSPQPRQGRGPRLCPCGRCDAGYGIHDQGRWRPAHHRRASPK